MPRRRERGKEKYKVCVPAMEIKAKAKNLKCSKNFRPAILVYCPTLKTISKVFVELIRMTLQDANASMSRTLYTDEDIEDIVAYIDTLDGRGRHSGINGNIEAEISLFQYA
ncbi:MAG: hypothetical protein CM1200mP30_03320 [Pseudomonadota bacterium]|nr:MAG: hypothetical protein CM1200mP30_03320 [Pseudomonadota bacterium]